MAGRLDAQLSISYVAEFGYMDLCMKLVEMGGDMITEKPR